MLKLFYIGKRTFFDIIRTSVFWVTILLAWGFIFLFFWYGWKVVHDPSVNNGHSAINLEMEGNVFPDITLSPQDTLLWETYGVTIGIGQLLAIFMMMGPLNQDLDRKRVDQLIARPVSRGQIFFGKLFGGWSASVLYMILVALWSLFCMKFSGMGYQKGYLEALAIGTLSLFLIGSIVYVMSANMKGLLSGFLGVIFFIASNRFGLIFIKMLGIHILKLNSLVWIIYKVLPPMQVIGEVATDHLHKGIHNHFFYAMAKAFADQLQPTVEDGLYSEMWHLWVYFAAVLLIGWLTFIRREFN